MARALKWQKHFIEEVEALSNKDFFERFIEENVPDDYDGAFTSRRA